MIAQAVSVAMSGRLVAAGTPARLLTSRVGCEFLLWRQPRWPCKQSRAVSCSGWSHQTVTVTWMALQLLATPWIITATPAC